MFGKSRIPMLFALAGAAAYANNEYPPKPAGPKAKYRGATKPKRRFAKVDFVSDQSPGSKIRKKMAKGTLTKNGIR